MSIPSPSVGFKSPDISESLFFSRGLSPIQYTNLFTYESVDLFSSNKLPVSLILLKITVNKHGGSTLLPTVKDQYLVTTLQFGGRKGSIVHYKSKTDPDILFIKMSELPLIFVGEGSFLDGRCVNDSPTSLSHQVFTTDRRDDDSIVSCFERWYVLIFIGYFDFLIIKGGLISQEFWGRNFSIIQLRRSRVPLT